MIIENSVFQTGAKSEHGFSVLIEGQGKRILFDTGQTEAMIANLELFEVEPESIDAIVLSHGHYDHTGGLYALLERNSHATVFAKSQLFEPKYHGSEKFIGTPLKQSQLNDRIVFVNYPMEIDAGIFIMPDIRIFDDSDTHFSQFLVEKDKQLVPDTFEDELYMAIVKDAQLNLLSGCSHRGITNIIRSAQSWFNLPLGLVLGGFHTFNESIESTQVLTKFFKQYPPLHLAVCHCTGIEQYGILKSQLSCPVSYSSTGQNIFI